MLGTESDVAGPNPGAVPPPVAPAPAPAAPVVAPPPATAADAARAVGVAKDEAATATAQAEADAAKEREDQLRQQQLFQETHAKAIADANRETAEAFKNARETHVKGFWDGHEGSQAVSAIAVGLGGIAAGLLKTDNTAAQYIQKNIDDYYRKEKDKIDNLYKYAEQKGKLTGEMRYQYAQDLTNLQTAMAATNMSAAEKIRAIAAASKGKVDKAEADLQAKILEAKSQKDLEESHANAVKLKLTQAETAAKYADIGLKRDEHQRKVEADAERAANAKAALEARGIAVKEKADAAKETRAVRDPDSGEVLGYAPNARQVTGLSKDIANTNLYVDAINELADHIAKYGRIVNPFSAEGVVRKKLAADAQAIGRSVKGIQASDAGQKLEHEIIGGDGVGLGALRPMADPKVLRSLSEQARKKTRQTLISALEPVEGQTKATVPAGSAAKMVTLVNKKTGEKKQVTEDEARAIGAIK